MLQEKHSFTKQKFSIMNFFQNWKCLMHLFFSPVYSLVCKRNYEPTFWLRFHLRFISFYPLINKPDSFVVSQKSPFGFQSSISPSNRNDNNDRKCHVRVTWPSDNRYSDVRMDILDFDSRILSENTIRTGRVFYTLIQGLSWKVYLGTKSTVRDGKIWVGSKFHQMYFEVDPLTQSK